MTPPPSGPDLSRSLLALLEREALLPPGPVVVAFSGGPDSLCLLHLLADLAPHRGWRLVAAHLDHALRAESAAEVASVRALAAARDVPLRTDRIDVTALAATRGWSTEQAARIARYGFLAQVAAEAGGASVVVGHTRDDQAETLLLRLARGAGLTGLRAMRLLTLLPPSAWDGPPSAPPLRIVRPLLTTSRAAIEAELAARHLVPLRDPSNTDPAYARNRLRHDLLTAWQTLDPGITLRLARSAEVLAADEEYLVTETERVWATLRPSEQPGPALIFDRQALLAQPLALRRRLLRRAVSLCRPGSAPRLATIDAALTVVASTTGGRFDLGHGLTLAVGVTDLWVGPQEHVPVSEPPAGPWMTPGTTVPLALDGALLLPGGAWRIDCAVRPASQCVRPLAGTHAHFTLALAGGQPFFRTWQPGDHLTPPGLNGHKKLHDLFIDRKVPRAHRHFIPLLVAGGSIAWVVGYAVGEPYRATGAEESVVCCTAVPAVTGPQPAS